MNAHCTLKQHLIYKPFTITFSEKIVSNNYNLKKYNCTNFFDSSSIIVIIHISIHTTW